MTRWLGGQLIATGPIVAPLAVPPNRERWDSRVDGGAVESRQVASPNRLVNVAIYLGATFVLAVIVWSCYAVGRAEGFF